MLRSKSGLPSSRQVDAAAEDARKTRRGSMPWSDNSPVMTILPLLVFCGLVLLFIASEKESFGGHHNLSVKSRVAHLFHGSVGAANFTNNYNNAFGVMLPKSGSTSLADYLGGTHEWKIVQLGKSILTIGDKKLSLEMAKRSQDYFHKFGSGVADINTFYFLIAELLCEEYPDATFYTTTRNVYEWVDSYLGWVLDDNLLHPVLIKTEMYMRATSSKQHHLKATDSKTVIRTMANIWCDHNAEMRQLGAKCKLINVGLDEMKRSRNAQKQAEKQSNQNAILNQGKIQTNLSDRPDLLAEIAAAIASSAECR